jgi:sterol desaturase/sphingolipid hydroxylase (fatty acid hydroxylase superfamily)
MKWQRVPNWLSGTLALGLGSWLLWQELRRPLRRTTESKLHRNARNLAVAGAGAAVLQLAERPLIVPLAALVERRGLGLLQQLPLPGWLTVPLAVVLLDYTLYLWHVLTHRTPWLWRFHVVHHLDRDLDASTALRFHFVELLASIPWRAGQVLLIGVSPLALSLWQTLLFLSILFHHSNIELPIEWERRLNRFIVTPRMHGIHHSLVRAETDSNWSSGLTLWDWLHGTLRRNVPQQEIIIGVPAYRDSAEVGLAKILKLPFVAQPPSWQLPDGSEPVREITSDKKGQLSA